MGCFGGGPFQQMPFAYGHAVQRAGHGIRVEHGLRQQLRQVPRAGQCYLQQLPCALQGEAAAHESRMVRKGTGDGAYQRPGDAGRRRQCQGQRQGQAMSCHGQHDQQQRHGRNQGAAQVVEQLPSVDGRQLPVPAVPQHGQQLPVPAHPAMQPGCCRVAVQRVRLHHGHIGDRRAAGQRAFQQVMAEDAVLGQALRQHGVQGLHMEKALADETAFSKEVLVHIRSGCAVGVHAPLSGKKPLPGRGLPRLRQGCHHVRLQDAVAAYDLAPGGIQFRLVVRVLGDAHQGPDLARRQFGVAVQRQHIAHAGRQVGQHAHLQEGGRHFRRQRRHQLLELAALALPAHPQALRRAEGPGAVQQQKALRLALPGGVAQVERLYLFACLREQRLIVGRALPVRIRPIAQQREMDTVLRIGEIVQLQAVCQFGDGSRLAQQRRNDDQGARRGVDPLLQEKARQMRWSGGLADEPVHQGQNRLGGREKHEQSQQGQACMAHPCVQRAQGTQRTLHRGGIACAVEVQHPCHQGQRSCHNGADVGDRARQQEDGIPAVRQGPSRAEHVLQLGASLALQPVPGQLGCALRLAHQPDEGPGHGGLGAIRAARGQALYAMQRSVAAGIVLGQENGRGLQCAHNQAGPAHDTGPVPCAHQPQRGHRIAHAQVVGRAVGMLLHLQCRQIGHCTAQPLFDLHVRAVAEDRAMPEECLRQMGQEDLAYAAQLHQAVDFVEAGSIEPVDMARSQDGHLLGRRLARNPLRQAPQILDQNHPQRGGQRPELTLAEFALALVCVKKAGQ